MNLMGQTAILPPGLGAVGAIPGKIRPRELMTQSEVIAQLQPIFDDLFLEPVVLTPELTAHDVEEWTSLLQISISLAVEQRFGIRFRVGEVEATKNVGEFAQLIARRVANK